MNKTFGLAQTTFRALWKKAPRFIAPNDGSPRELFTDDASGYIPGADNHLAGLYVRRDNPREMLIFVAGCSLDQNDIDGTTARAGCAWLFRPPPLPFEERVMSIRLEQEGPWSEEHPHTSDRAELRAVIGALEHGCWYERGFKNVVIASSSNYLMLGITRWIDKWLSYGWQDTSGTVVQNQDLWKALLSEITRYSLMDTEVLFWKIPDYENTEADIAARNAARTKPNVKQYTGTVLPKQSSD